MPSTDTTHSSNPPVFAANVQGVPVRYGKAESSAAPALEIENLRRFHFTGEAPGIDGLAAGSQDQPRAA